MGWKRVAWAGCLAPVLGGCHTTFPESHDLVADKLLVHTEKAIEHDIHKHALAAWREVRCQHPRRAFTPEFRDGFLDGYADYLDRGGDAQPPAVPPLRYTRHQKYYTPEGHALIRDYYLGFKYGADVAVATGQRQFLTVPVLVPDQGSSPPPVVVPVPVALPAAPPPVAVPMTPPPPLVVPKPPGSDDPLPLSAPRTMPPQVNPPASSGIPGYHLPSWNGTGPKPAAAAKSAAPQTRPPAAPDDAAATKFAPLPRMPDPDAKLPPPFPPLPVAPQSAVPPPHLPGAVSIPELPADPGAKRPEFAVKLPEPPAEVPTLPAGVPTPPLMDEVPQLPPNHTAPPELPVNHPDPVRK